MAIGEDWWTDDSALAMPVLAAESIPPKLAQLRASPITVAYMPHAAPS